LGAGQFRGHSTDCHEWPEARPPTTLDVTILYTRAEAFRGNSFDVRTPVLTNLEIVPMRTRQIAAAGRLQFSTSGNRPGNPLDHGLVIGQEHEGSKELTIAPEHVVYS